MKPLAFVICFFPLHLRGQSLADSLHIYERSVVSADSSFAVKSYDAAHGYYNLALKYKPGDEYAEKQLKILGDGLYPGCGSKLEEKYNAAVAKGDLAFSKQAYGEAKKAYTEALYVKPGEAYPKQKIAEIEKRYGCVDPQIKAYEKLVQQGDSLLNIKNWEAAKRAYMEALKIKPDEQYPKDKLAEFDKVFPKKKE